MTAPTVSVLMTAYNRARFIGPAIESVLAQSYRDFELLVVDDASTDETVAVARDYARCDGRIRVTVNAGNLGQFGNRNHAASLAAGAYLKFHDSDDLMYPHCLQVMVSACEANPAADLAMTSSRPWPGGPVPMLLSPRDCYRREFLGFGLFHGGPACALIKTEAFHRVGGFPTLGVHSDHLFWMKLCRHAHVVLVAADLFWYRVHAQQELSSPNARRDYAGLDGEVWRALDHPDCPLEGDELERARRHHAWNVAKHALRDVRRGDPQLAWFRLRHAGLTVRDWFTYLRRPRRSADAGVARGR
jgi:glycosyltransferase involved in cell wall biosynthesis